MDIRQLTYFIEVAKHKSFTKAALALHVTQPTLSKMVKNLEEEMEVTLFDRSSRQIELTDAGAVVFEQAQKIVVSLDDLTASLYDVMNLKKGKIKIGLPPVISTLFFPTIIAEFQKAYPEVTVMLAEDGAKKVEQKVLEGEVDLGFVMLPVDEEKFDVVPFVHEEIKLLVHESHPLAHRETIDLIECKDDPFLLLSKEFTLNGRTIEFCLSEGFTPKIAYESSQWDFIVGMVEKNLGITLMPKLICERSKNGPFKTLSLTNTFPWVLGIISAKNRYLPYTSRSFISLVKDLPKV
ncbi:LysR family transcriptional regulator [Planococcus liqunii]|uniref:LysR family transcriptional regulator n=1 Tax=Planococcus liqunii TaxID=3058394 RepID=A0ABT8MRS3_9BACL|nr:MULTISPECIES: LysR family transcriptional regulator [unclassified Planococcus (in: firmicutes)]MDN7227551.1 LysR family transcriptional regulator [Planococcus sp. N064]WKA51930.1 LysR family transcriptional regulator [Planococcus sp. N056]